MHVLAPAADSVFVNEPGLQVVQVAWLAAENVPAAHCEQVASF
jgi:hypothetical protein